MTPFDEAFIAIPGQLLIISLIIWQERRLRKVEETLNKLLGAQNERRSHER